jgi:hypothetical protein
VAAAGASVAAAAAPAPSAPTTQVRYGNVRAQRAPGTRTRASIAAQTWLWWWMIVVIVQATTYSLLLLLGLVPAVRLVSFFDVLSC